MRHKYPRLDDTCTDKQTDRRFSIYIYGSLAFKTGQLFPASTKVMGIPQIYKKVKNRQEAQIIKRPGVRSYLIVANINYIMRATDLNSQPWHYFSCLSSLLLISVVCVCSDLYFGGLQLSWCCCKLVILGIGGGGGGNITVLGINEIIHVNSI